MYQNVCLYLRAVCSEIPHVKWNATALDWTSILLYRSYVFILPHQWNFSAEMRYCNHSMDFFKYEHIRNRPFLKYWTPLEYTKTAISSTKAKIITSEISAQIVWQMNIFIGNESAAIGRKQTKLSVFMIYKNRIPSKKGCGKILWLQMVLLPR